MRDSGHTWAKAASSTNLLEQDNARTRLAKRSGSKRPVAHVEASCPLIVDQDRRAGCWRMHRRNALTDSGIGASIAEIRFGSLAHLKTQRL